MRPPVRPRASRHPQARHPGRLPAYPGCLIRVAAAATPASCQALRAGELATVPR
jgi:hypothetical protein